MPITLNGDTGITTPSYGGADAAEYIVPVTAFKNRIINGAMQIDQRNAGAAVSVINTTGFYAVDRFLAIAEPSLGVFTIQRSTVAPSGFTNSLLATVTTANISTANSQYNFMQRIEGFNVADLGWGTANAQAVTLSFWVRSSLTGTFAGGISNNDGTRSYVFTYTINSANTYEYKTVTIAGDTSGTWLTNNGIGFRVIFDLGSGSTFQTTAGSWVGTYSYATSSSVKLMATNGATFYITGVQLEVGSTATSFDYRPYGTELQLCQRYLPAWTAPGSAEGLIAAGGCANTTVGAFTVIYPVTTRVPPTGVSVTNATHFSTWFTTSVGVGTGISFAGRASTQACQINLTTSGLTTGAAASLGFNSNATSSSVFLLTGCEL